MNMNMNGITLNRNTTINGILTFKNDVWNITNDNINRFYFANNSTTFLCSGGAANDNGLVVFSSGATGYANNLIIKLFAKPVAAEL